MILQRQKDADYLLWSSEYGTIVERARANNVIGDERWERYLKQGVRDRLLIRRDLTIGRDLRWGIRIHTRFGESSMWLKYMITLVSIEDHAFEHRPALNGEGRTRPSKTSVNGGVANIPWEVLIGPDDPEFGTGTHTVDAIVEYELTSSSDWCPAESDRVLLAWTEQLRQDVTIHPIGDLPVHGVPALEHEEAIGIALGPVAAQTYIDEAEDRMLPLTIWPPWDSPVNIAFSIFARDNDDSPEIQVSDHLAWATSDEGRAMVFVFEVSIPDNFASDNMIDVIFCSSAEAAYNHFDISKYWQGEILMKDVEVTPIENDAR